MSPDLDLGFPFMSKNGYLLYLQGKPVAPWPPIEVLNLRL